jgi:hypothetical protein
MTQPFEYIIRITVGEPTARPGDVRERLERATADFKVPARPHAEGFEVSGEDLAGAVEVITDPNVSRERVEAILDANPTLSNLPPRQPVTGCRRRRAPG